MSERGSERVLERVSERVASSLSAEGAECTVEDRSTCVGNASMLVDGSIWRFESVSSGESSLRLRSWHFGWGMDCDEGLWPVNVFAVILFGICGVVCGTFRIFTISGGGDSTLSVYGYIVNEATASCNHKFIYRGFLQQGSFRSWRGEVRLRYSKSF